MMTRVQFCLECAWKSVYRPTKHATDGCSGRGRQSGAIGPRPQQSVSRKTVVSVLVGVGEVRTRIVMAAPSVGAVTAPNAPANERHIAVHDTLSQVRFTPGARCCYSRLSTYTMRSEAAL